MAGPMKASLPEPRQELVELMQRLNFGRIEGLHICDGDPVFSPEPRTVREFKFCAAENGPRTELTVRDFVLKSQVVELFALLDDVRNGVIDLIEVKHGLPFRAFLSGATA